MLLKIFGIVVVSFRISTKFNENKTKCELVVHNHIADFNSKYNLDGEFFHTTSQWGTARIFDLNINKNMNRGCELVNENSDGTFEATVLKPGNILEVNFSSAPQHKHTQT